MESVPEESVNVGRKAGIDTQSGAVNGRLALLVVAYPVYLYY